MHFRCKKNIPKHSTKITQIKNIPRKKTHIQNSSKIKTIQKLSIKTKHLKKSSKQNQHGWEKYIWQS